MSGFTFVAGVSALGFDHKPSASEYKARQMSVEYIELDLSDLYWCIVQGQSIGPVCAGVPPRKDNWLRQQHIAVDLEGNGDAALAVVATNRLFSSYGALAYTTMSHTEQAPRSRAVFVLDGYIDSPETWRLAAKAIARSFGTAVDQASWSIGHFFLGNPNTASIRPYNVMPRMTALLMANSLRREVEQEQAARRSPDFTGSANITGLCDAVRTAQSGKRNHMLYWAAAAGASDSHVNVAELEPALLNAALAAGLTRHESQGTIRSGLHTGLKERPI